MPKKKEKDYSIPKLNDPRIIGYYPSLNKLSTDELGVIRLDESQRFYRRLAAAQIRAKRLGEDPRKCMWGLAWTGTPAEQAALADRLQWGD